MAAQESAYKTIHTTDPLCGQENYRPRQVNHTVESLQAFDPRTN